VDITDLINFHREQKTLATLTAVQPPGRFGAFSLSEGQTKVLGFKEKPAGEGAWINGGFFILEPGVIDYIKEDSTVWEKEPLQNMARSGMLSAYRHHGFWHSLDTLRDKYILEEIWQSGQAPWRVW
jgi:glucose-1-phosphate cytidylyltransferase